MPLKVYLPPPAGGLVPRPGPGRRGDTPRGHRLDGRSPGIPSFEFVGKAGDADIPIMWANAPPSSSFASIAHCAWRIDFPTRRFAVENVLITAWNRDGTQVSVEDLHRTLLHEMGHALGIGGHSPNPEDIMYPWRDAAPGSIAEGWVLPSKSKSLTERDRETLRKLYAKPNGTVLAGVRRVY